MKLYGVYGEKYLNRGALGQRSTVDSGLRGNGSVEDTDSTSEEVQ